MRVWPVVAIALAGGLALGIWSGSGPDPGKVPTSDQVAGRMMSPFCPGLTLEECPSDQASRVREEIDQMVAAGATNSEIDRWIVDNFGEVALARPPSSIAWLAPPLLAAAGAGVVAMVLRRRVKPTASEPVELTEHDETLFEQDFGRFQRGSE